MLLLYYFIEQMEVDVIRSKTNVSLTHLEVGYLQLNYGDLCKQIRQGTYEGSYWQVVNRVRNAIKTATKFKLQSDGCPYSFDGPIVDARGQGNTSFQYAYRNSTVYCAKIGKNAVVKPEFAIGKLVGVKKFPSVMPVAALVPVPDEQTNDRVALLTPFYPASLVRFCGAIADDDILNAARCTLAAIVCFQKIGYCHGDIKPANMMLSNVDNVVVTIDFGSAALVGSFASGGTSDFYGLDATFGDIWYDRSCLAVSLAHLKWGDEFKDVKTISDFSLFCDGKGECTVVNVIKMLLNQELSIDELWKFMASSLDGEFYADASVLRPDLDATDV